MSAGIKYDKDKPAPALVLHGFRNALLEVSKLATFGAEKYAEDNWEFVENGYKRYTNAMLRHYLSEHTATSKDPETGLLEAAHIAWNALARLELLLKELQCDEKQKV